MEQSRVPMVKRVADRRDELLREQGVGRNTSKSRTPTIIKPNRSGQRQGCCAAGCDIHLAPMIDGRETRHNPAPCETRDA
jgi:hypothetical protein